MEFRSNSFAALCPTTTARNGGGGGGAGSSSPPSPAPSAGGSSGGGRRRRRARTASLAETRTSAGAQGGGGGGSASAGLARRPGSGSFAADVAGDGGAAAATAARRPAVSDDDTASHRHQSLGDSLLLPPEAAGGTADAGGGASDGGLASPTWTHAQPSSLVHRRAGGARSARLPTIDSPADPPALAAATSSPAAGPAAHHHHHYLAPLLASPRRVPPTALRPASSLAAYVHALLHPPPAPLPRMPGGVALPPWGQTERQRVYNALLAVPYQLERLLWFGGCVCADAWGAAFTALPLRCAAAAGRAGRAALAAATATPAPPWPQAGADLYDGACAAVFGVAAAALCAVPGGALYFWMKDLTQEFLKLHVIYTAIEIGDKIGCSFAVDALDALAGTCARFAAAGATGGGGGGGGGGGAPPPPSSRLHVLPSLAADATVAAALVTAHGLVLMCHGMALAVAMHSTRGHTLLALTVAANFVELKGTIFKRYDGSKLFSLAAQDVVERFHLVLALAFVLVEAGAAAGGGGKGGGGGRREAGMVDAAAAAAAAAAPPASPSSSSARAAAALAPVLLRRCAQVLGAELAIDLIKHAVVCKFNDVRPGMYREFFKDVCEAVVDSTGGGGEGGGGGGGGGDGGGGGGGGGGEGGGEAAAPPLHHHHHHTTTRAGFQPQAGSRLLVFDPLAAAAFTVRLGVGWAAGRSGDEDEDGGGGRGLAAAALWWSAAFAVACVAKVALGFGLRVAAQAYLGRYARVHGTRLGGGGGGPVKRE